MGEAKEKSNEEAIVSPPSNKKPDDQSTSNEKEKEAGGESEVMRDLRDDALSPHFCKLLGASGAMFYVLKFSSG